MRDLKIGTKCFGPLQEAYIELKPLTIFVGSNNTGKSYMAQLIYAITHAGKLFNEEEDSRFWRSAKYRDTYLSRMRYISPGEEHFDKRALTQFGKLLPNNFMESTQGSTSRSRTVEINFDSMPQVMQEYAYELTMNNLRIFGEELAREIERCFDAKISKLICKMGSEENERMSVQIVNDNPILNMIFESEKNHLKEVKIRFSLKNKIIRAYLPRLFMRGKSSEDTEKRRQEEIVRRTAASMINHSGDSISDIFPRNAYYLPAARSGILHGQKAIARVGLRTMQRAGMETISIPKLSGTVIDFLDAIYSIDKDEKGDYFDLAKQLEKRLTNGRIEFIEGKNELPEIYFREPSVGRLELHRTSSMISEMAPVILLLRYLLKKGDMLIIEEPESHMHPGAQREMAVVVATLVNRGLNVILTTHSDYLLQQLSNLVAFTYKDNSALKKWGYSEENLLTEDKVSGYLFSRGCEESSTIVKKLEIGQKGISEDEFSTVAEALFREGVEVSS